MNPDDLVNLRIEHKMHQFLPDIEMKSVILKCPSCGLSYIFAQREVSGYEPKSSAQNFSVSVSAADLACFYFGVGNTYVLLPYEFLNPILLTCTVSTEHSGT
jgi:hypothetical protein